MDTTDLLIVRMKTNKCFINKHYSLRPGDCPGINFGNVTISLATEVKYLGLLLNRRLTWGPHLKIKRKQLNSHLHILKPLLISNINLSNRLPLYITLLQPIWSYGIALWLSKPSNTRTIQAFQAICLHLIAINTPGCVSNLTLHKDLRIPIIKQTASTYYSSLFTKINQHPNSLIAQLHSNELLGNPVSDA